MTEPPTLVIDPAVVLVKPRYQWLPGRRDFRAAVAEAKEEIGRCLLNRPRQPLRCFKRGVGAYISRLFRPTFGSLITWGISKVDKGQYTHTGLTVDGWLIDARARAPVAGQRPPIVFRTPLAELIKSRESDAYDYLADGRKDGRPNQSAIKKAFEVGDPDPPVGDRPTSFGYGGLMRLGIILATSGTRKRWLRRLGKRLTRRAVRKDPPGLFCSEHVSKAIVVSGSRLFVSIHPGRDFGDIDDEVIKDRLQAEGSPSIDANSVDAVRQQLAAVQEFMKTVGLTSDGRIPIEVGEGDRKLPAWLVTPHDLQESESLRSRGPIASV